MIRYKSTKQIRIEEFAAPFDMKMDPDNRWVKMAEHIPWDELAAIYHRSMDKTQGAPIKDARIVIGALIIKHMLRLDDRGVIEMISENPYMQYFLGLDAYTAKPVFSPSLFVAIRRRLGLEAFDQMNQQIISMATGRKSPVKTKRPSADEPDQGEDPPNQGKLQIDATVADADIKFPTDVDLLNASRLKAEVIIDLLYEKLGLAVKPRTYRRKARQAYLNFSKKKNRSHREVRNAIKAQLGYLGRNIRHIHQMLDQFNKKSFPLDKHLQKYLFVVQHVHDQQKEMYEQRKHTCADRIVNIHQPHVRPIVRGKAGKNVEFGAKINVSLQDGYSRIDRFSWDAFHEGVDLKNSVESYKGLHGHYPEVVLVDRIYLSRENRNWLKSKGIRHTGKALGRPPKLKKSPYERAKARKEAAERNHIEGAFGFGKRRYGLNNILAKTARTAESWVAAIIFTMNLARFFKESLCSFLSFTQIAITELLFENYFINTRFMRPLAA